MIGDLTTVQAVKLSLTLGRNITADVGILERLITATSSNFRSILGRELLSTSYDEIRDGTGTGTLVLANYPVTAVASVELGSPVATRSPLVLNTDYVWTTTTIRLLGNQRFPKSVANVAVSYTAGYATIPADISDACAKTVALRYRQLERLGQLSKTLANETVTFDTSDFSDDVNITLENYKRRIQIGIVR